MKCISCNKELTEPYIDAGFGFKICQACEDTGNQMAAFLEEGIELEYSDGTNDLTECLTVNEKTDEQLLAEANALDAAYASAEIHDLRHQIQYLERVLAELVIQIRQDIAPEAGSKHFWYSVETAEDVLGFHDTDERDFWS